MSDGAAAGGGWDRRRWLVLGVAADPVDEQNRHARHRSPIASASRATDARRSAPAPPRTIDPPSRCRRARSEQDLGLGPRRRERRPGARTPGQPHAGDGPRPPSPASRCAVAAASSSSAETPAPQRSQPLAGLHARASPTKHHRAPAAAKRKPHAGARQRASGTDAGGEAAGGRAEARGHPRTAEDPDVAWTRWSRAPPWCAA